LTQKINTSRAAENRRRHCWRGRTCREENLNHTPSCRVQKQAKGRPAPSRGRKDSQFATESTKHLRKRRRGKSNENRLTLPSDQTGGKPTTRCWGKSSARGTAGSRRNRSSSERSQKIRRRKKKTKENAGQTKNKKSRRKRKTAEHDRGKKALV